MRSWLLKKFKSPIWLVSLTIIFLLPALSGLIGRWVKGKIIIGGNGDFEAIACAAERLNDGRTLYPPPEAFLCEGMEPASYVYTPWVARTFNMLIELLSFQSVKYLYFSFFWVGLAAMIILPMIVPKIRGTYVERAPFLGLVTGSIFYWGNIAGIAYALIVMVAFIAGQFPWMVLPFIILAGAIKPTYLTFLAVLLFFDISLYKRAFLFLMGAVIGLMPTLIFMMSGSSELSAWKEVITYFGYELSPGGGFFGWFALLGIDGREPVVILAYFIYAAAMIMAGFGACERRIGSGSFSRHERLWLGLAIGNLLNPRLLAYDYLLFAPGMIVLVYATMGSDRQLWGKPLSRRITQLVIGGAIGAWFMNTFDMGDYACQFGTLCFAAAVLVAGLPEFWPALSARPEFQLWRQRLSRSTPE